jgi:hypothetical protein
VVGHGPIQFNVMSLLTVVLSAQATWKDAVDKDSCVADQAAAVSYSEVNCVALSMHASTTQLLSGICTSNGGTYVRGS